MPRAALLSIHARVEGTEPSAWEDEAQSLPLPGLKGRIVLRWDD